MRNTGHDLKTVLDVLARDDHSCVCCGTPVRGDRGVDWSIGHRKPRGLGGSSDPAINRPSNLITLAGSGTTGCHGAMESNRAWALEHGYLVSRYSDPAMVAVLIRGRRYVYLGDDARYHDEPPLNAGIGDAP